MWPCFRYFLTDFDSFHINFSMHHVVFADQTTTRRWRSRPSDYNCLDYNCLYRFSPTMDARPTTTDRGSANHAFRQHVCERGEHRTTARGMITLISTRASLDRCLTFYNGQRP